MREEALKAEMKRVHADNYAVFGVRKMHVMLDQAQVTERHGAGYVARCTIERLMRAMGAARHPARQVTVHCPLRREGSVLNRPGEPTLLGVPPQPAVGGGHHVCPDLQRVGVRRVRNQSCTHAASRGGRRPLTCTPTWPWTP